MDHKSVNQSIVSHYNSFYLTAQIYYNLILILKIEIKSVSRLTSETFHDKNDQ